MIWISGHYCSLRPLQSRTLGRDPGLLALSEGLYDRRSHLMLSRAAIEFPKSSLYNNYRGKCAYLTSHSVGISGIIMQRGIQDVQCSRLQNDFVHRR